MSVRAYVRVKLSCYRRIELVSVDIIQAIISYALLKRNPHYTQDKCTTRFHHKKKIETEKKEKRRLGKGVKHTKQALVVSPTLASVGDSVNKKRIIKKAELVYVYIKGRKKKKEKGSFSCKIRVQQKIKIKRRRKGNAIATFLGYA